jgi:eukaryotic-like serine/threonine-protein kinase
VDSSLSPVQPGDVVAGKFRVDRIIGMGGVGVVVAARHLGLGETVALKFLVTGATRDPTDVARFVREAQSAVKLKNEHVARVIDVDALPDGSPFMVMEYLEGRDVGETLRSDGPLAVVQAVDVALQVCEAVAEAHSLGIVHRDLKPSNFFLTTHRDGSSLVKVLDFGIAKARAELEEKDVSLTQTRTLLGSPVYMSPEQVRSARSVDHRSDIWSLGVSLFEMLTDTVPFAGDTVTSVAAAVATDPVPPIATRRSDVPPGLVAAIEKCLAKSAEDRYQSVAELAEALVGHGPEDGPAMVQRIRGTLGLRRSSGGSVLRDSGDLRLPINGATTLHGHNTTVRHEPPRSRRSLGVFAVLALLTIGVGALAINYVLSLASAPLPPTAADSRPGDRAVLAAPNVDAPERSAPSAPPGVALPQNQAPDTKEQNGSAAATGSPMPQMPTASPAASLVPSALAAQGRLSPPFSSRPSGLAPKDKGGRAVAAPSSVVTPTTPRASGGGIIDDMVDTRR